jgi:hypothetical protein
MNTRLKRTVMIVAAATFVAIGSHAQEGRLDETLALINRTLETHSYEDGEGSDRGEPPRGCIQNAGDPCTCTPQQRTWLGDSAP